MSISVKHLTKQYGSQVAVNRISFSLNKGEIVGFLGPNGAGKSTTMKMITGYLECDGGEIEVCGIPVVTDTIDTKKKIGYLPEANPLYTEMYVREYLGFLAGVHKITKPASRIEEVIRIVGLMPESGKKIGQLSKGYKQRVGLAAALIHDPEVLILDEPTTGLDPNQIIEIRELIKTLGQNKTVLFSSHIMQEVEAICDRVIIINKGNIVADERLHELRKTSSGNQYVTVEFKGPVDISTLKSLPGVVDIRNSQPAKFHIQSTDADALKKELLKLSIANNLDIVSLTTDAENLESVFKSLTT